MQNRTSEVVRMHEWSAGTDMIAIISPTHPRIPTDTVGMQIERDGAGRVHIEDDGVSAIIDEHGGQSSFSMTSTASPVAVKRVCEAVEDKTQWPTMRLPRVEVVLGS